jgi:hypothetical protein
MATLTVTEPDPTFVTLYGTLRYPDWTPMKGTKVIIKVEPTPQMVENTFLDRTELSVLTNKDGYFEFVLPGQIYVTLVVLDANFKATGQLPSSGTMEATLLGRVNP